MGVDERNLLVMMGGIERYILTSSSYYGVDMKLNLTVRAGEARYYKG